MAEAATIHVDIVSAEGELFSGPAAAVFAAASQGNIGIYPRHAPLLSLLKAGEVRVLTPDGEEHMYFVGGGALEVQPQKVTVLAVPPLGASSLQMLKSPYGVALMPSTVSNVVASVVVRVVTETS